MEREFLVGMIKEFLEEVLFELIGILIGEDEENGSMVYGPFFLANNVSLSATLTKNHWFHNTTLQKHKILMTEFYTYSNSGMSSYTWRMNFYYVQNMRNYDNYFRSSQQHKQLLNHKTKRHWSSWFLCVCYLNLGKIGENWTNLNCFILFHITLEGVMKASDRKILCLVIRSHFLTIQTDKK